MTERIATPAKKRKWLPCGCLLVMFLLCFLLPLAFFMAWSFTASSQVAEQMARIRQAELPTNAAELEEFYRLEAGVKDATQFYLDAHTVFSQSSFENDCRQIPIVGTSEQEIPPPGQPWADQQAVEEFLAKYDDGLQSLHQAVAVGGAARFPLEFEHGVAMLLPNAQKLRTSARMLTLQAHVRAHQGDAKGAAESIRAVATISNAMRAQPMIISQLVRVAVNSVAIDVTNQLLPHVDFSDEDLASLQEVFRDADFKDGYARSLVGERVLGAAAIKNPAVTMEAAGAPNVASRLVRGSNEDLALLLKIYSDAWDASALEYPDSLDGVDMAGQELRAKLSSPFGRLRYVMTALTLSATEAAAHAAARGDGLSRCIDTALAVERFRLREGKLPAALDELVPDFLDEVPIDPFDGKPVRYQIKEDAYLLYVCGRNRTDDGGLDDKVRSDDVIRIELTSPDAEATGDEATEADPAPSAAKPAAAENPQ